MPRGKKLNPTGRTKKQRISISDRINTEAEALALKLGLVNPRTGEGNRSELVERAIAAMSNYYPHYLPKQNELLLWVIAITNNQDISPQIREEAEAWAEYIESWGIEQLLNESVADGETKAPSGAWIL